MPAAIDDVRDNGRDGRVPLVLPGVCDESLEELLRQIGVLVERQKPGVPLKRGGGTRRVVRDSQARIVRRPAVHGARGQRPRVLSAGGVVDDQHAEAKLPTVSTLRRTQQRTERGRVLGALLVQHDHGEDTNLAGRG